MMLLAEVVVGETYWWDGTDGSDYRFEPEPRPAKVIFVGNSSVAIDDPDTKVHWFVDASSLSPMPKESDPNEEAVNEDTFIIGKPVYDARIAELEARIKELEALADHYKNAAIKNEYEVKELLLRAMGGIEENGMTAAELAGMLVAQKRFRVQASCNRIIQIFNNDRQKADDKTKIWKTVEVK